MANTTYATNKKARHDYAIQDTYVAGLVLAGHEVKSIRNGGAQLKSAYVTLSRNGEAWLTNAHIRPYAHAGPLADYEPSRSRKLLLTAKELAALQQAREGGYTIVALSLFPAGPHIKLSIGTARAKKKYDKRQDIKKRDTQRDTERSFRGR